MSKRIIFICILSISFLGFAQNDSLVQAYAAQKDRKELQEEQKDLNFEKFFFDALTQKAIGNHDKAITSLENCLAIRPDDSSVNFELSKNYYVLEKYFEATSYIQKALAKDSTNIFLLEHLKDIYTTEKNYKAALDIQQKIVLQKPLHLEDLILLYIRNNQIEEAKNVLLDLEKRGMLSDNLLTFKQSLLPNHKSKKALIQAKSIDELSLEELKTIYDQKKTFKVLKKILVQLELRKEYLELQSYSLRALELFPAQPLVYLMHAKALNKLKKYSDALVSLQNGIDYVIDNIEVESQFYDELSLSYKGLGKNIDASKYYNLALETRKKTPQ